MNISEVLTKTAIIVFILVIGITIGISLETNRKSSTTEYNKYYEYNVINNDTIPCDTIVEIH